MPNEIRAVVFDLADVLFDFAGPESLARLSNGHIGPEEFNRLWSSPFADALYRGACTLEEFAVRAVAQLGLSIAPDAFLQSFASWFRGPFTGALELVERVRAAGVVVACLSNTNPLDVARFRAELDIDRRFDWCFFSNEIQLRKPDPACYTHVLERLGLSQEPERVLFLDDSLINVEAARTAGLRAYQVRGIAGVESCLGSLGLTTRS